MSATAHLTDRDQLAVVFARLTRDELLEVACMQSLVRGDGETRASLDALRDYDLIAYALATAG